MALKHQQNILDSSEVLFQNKMSKILKIYGFTI